MIERVIRTLEEQCIHRRRFETLQRASRVIGDWIGCYDRRRPHQALRMRTPAEAYAFTALPGQVQPGHCTIQTTLRYAYLSPGNFLDALEALEAA